MRKVGKKGFTLVEVLAVIVVIGIIATIAIVAISRYVEGGKEDYNKKLKDELTLAGKNYYSEHKEELPTLENGKSFSYVALPEMQSNNYISKTFVDSEGRECSPSYVYVRQKSYNSKEYIYVPCLICQDEHGDDKKSYSDEVYCEVGDWTDKVAPTCGPTNGTAQSVNYKAVESIKVDNVNDYTDEAKTKTGRIAAVIITNTNNNDEYYIDASKIGTECASTDAACKFRAIEQLNIKDYFTRHFKESDEAEYEVRLVDEGMNVSDPCASFFIIEPDSCEGYQNDTIVTIKKARAAAGFKELYYRDKDGNEQSVGLSSKYVGKKIISNYTFNNKLSSDKTIPWGAQFYFKDKDDKKILCPLVVEPKKGVPSCAVTKAPTAVIGNAGADVEVTCKLCLGETCVDIEVNDVNRIYPDGNGRIGPIKIETDGKTGVTKGKTILFKFKYYPKNAQTDGESKLTVGDKLVRRVNADGSITYNEEVSTIFDVDGIYPTIEQKPIISGGWVSDNGYCLSNQAYRGSGYMNTVTITKVCTDNRTKVFFSPANQTTNTPNDTYVVTSNVRGTYPAIASTCYDEAGNKATHTTPAYRVMQQAATCGITTTATYQKCENKAFGCKEYKYKSGKSCKCVKSKTTYSTSCIWHQKPKNGKAFDYGKCSKDGQTYYNSGVQMTCKCKTTSSTTCTERAKCIKTDTCLKWNSKAASPCPCKTANLCWY